MEVTPLEVHHATREPTSPCRHDRAFEDRVQLKEMVLPPTIISNLQNNEDI